MKPLGLKRVAGLTLAAVLLGTAVVVLHRELSAHDYRDLVRDLRSLPPPRVLLAVLLTALNYAVLAGYDGLALRFIGRPLPLRRVAFASYTAFAVSNSLGFPLLTGVPLRYRLYSHWGVPGIDIARIAAFSSLTFWTGLLAVGGFSFLLDPLATPALLHVPVDTLRPVGALMLLLLAGYLGLSAAHRRELRLGRFSISPPAPGLALRQVVVSSLDWMLAASVLYALLPGGTLSFPAFLGVFVLAQLAGLLSLVPAGLGVFDTILLLFLTPALTASQAMGVLLVYRGVYYLLPLALAAVGLAVHEGRRLAAKTTVPARAAGWAAALAPRAMAGLVFLAGALLLFSGATPAIGTRLAWLSTVLPLPLIEASHLMGSVAGVALLLLARGLQLRLKDALRLTQALLAAGIALSLLRGLDYEEAALLALVLAGLQLARAEFSRPAALSESRFTAGWTIAVAMALGATAWLGLFAYRHVEYSGELWWRFAPGADAPRFLRATLFAVVAAGAFGFSRLLRPAPAAPALPGPEELERAAAICVRTPEADARLVLLGDKSLLFSEDGEGFVMYAVEGRSWISMGDPVGPKETRRRLAWRFAELCDERAAWPVFYQARAASLPVYLELGLHLQKLGEEARVPLGDFSLDGSGRKDLRQAVRRMERDGVVFEVLPAEDVPAALAELRAVSDQWLATKGTAEKGFSLGRFDEAYLSRFPVATLRREGRIAAFASLWTTLPGGELSVDLMRHADDAPPGAMDALFASTMLWGREQGYAWFDLGMAPLAGLDERRQAPLWNRLAGVLYRHGEHFYNFQGLRRYKEKFDPVWEPRFLASPGGLALPQVLANLSTRIAGGLKEVVTR